MLDRVWIVFKGKRFSFENLKYLKFHRRQKDESLPTSNDPSRLVSILKGRTRFVIK